MAKSNVGAKSGMAKQAAPKMARVTSKSGGGLVTGGTKAWSGAAATAGGTKGKTYGGTSAKSSTKSLSTSGATGHTQGKMPGNMMAHSSSKTPFQNTGKQPQKGLAPTPKDMPGRAVSLDAGYKAKLAASTPYSSAPVISTNSWTGASGKMKK